MNGDWSRMAQELDMQVCKLQQERIRRIAVSGPNRSKDDADLCRALAKAAWKYWWPGDVLVQEQEASDD